MKLLTKLMSADIELPEDCNQLSIVVKSMGDLIVQSERVGDKIETLFGITLPVCDIPKNAVLKLHLDEVVD